MTGRKLLLMRTFAMAALLCMAGCDMVGVQQIKPKEYAVQRRSDVLSNKALSDSTVQTLNVVALTREACAENFARCTNTVLYSDGPG